MRRKCGYIQDRDEIVTELPHAHGGRNTSTSTNHQAPWFPWWPVHLHLHDAGPEPCPRKQIRWLTNVSLSSAICTNDNPESATRPDLVDAHLGLGSGCAQKEGCLFASSPGQQRIGARSSLKAAHSVTFSCWIVPLPV